jgi:hypothetical protein
MLNPRRYGGPYRNINYQGVVTAQWGSWGRPNTPPEPPLSPPEPLRCPLGPWSAPRRRGLSGGVIPPPPKPPHGRCAATTRAPDTRLDAVSPQPPPTGCWWAGGGSCGGLGRPGGGANPFSRRTSTLSANWLTSPPARTHRARSMLQADLIRGACLAMYI